MIPFVRLMNKEKRKNYIRGALGSLAIAYKVAMNEGHRLEVIKDAISYAGTLEGQTLVDQLTADERTTMTQIVVSYMLLNSVKAKSEECSKLMIKVATRMKDLEVMKDAVTHWKAAEVKQEEWS